MTSDMLLSIKEIKKFILPQFDIIESDVIPVKFKNTEKQRAVFRIICRKGNYCLKKIHFNEKELLFVYSAVEWCYRKGLSVPRFIPTILNGRYITYKGMLFLLTPWFNGKKCNFDDINHVTLSIENLAVMHAKGIGFLPIEGSFIRKGFDNQYISVQKHFTDIMNCSNSAFILHDKFSKIFLKHFPDNFDLAKKSLDILYTMDEKKLKTSLCHGDYVNKNILVDSDNTIQVIDFDNCRYDYIARDLSYFLRRMLRRENTLWNSKLALSCIKSYQSINPLGDEDMKYIIAYLIFPQKYWRISKDYYKNIKKFNKSSYVRLISKVTENTEFMLKFSHEMLDFMNKGFKI